MNFYMKQFSLTTQTSKKLSQSNIDLKKWLRIPAYTSGSLLFLGCPFHLQILNLF
jgi:hypothetical protein